MGNEVNEYKRVETIPYSEEITAYRSLNSGTLDKWALVDQIGYPEISIPNEGIGVLENWNNNHQNKE